MDLDLVEARWRLGVFPPEGLPDVARRIVADGRDGVALRALAELDRPTRSAAGSLFEDALDELGRERMSHDAAALIVARDLARRIVSGQLTPREGADKIAWEVWDQARELDQLGVFVTLLDKREREKDHRELVDEAILREARRLLEGS